MKHMNIVLPASTDIYRWNLTLAKGVPTFGIFEIRGILLRIYEGDDAKMVCFGTGACVLFDKYCCYLIG